jgi:hypothetical protein
MGLIDQGLKNFQNMALTELAKRADSGELSTDIEKIGNGIEKFFKEDLKEIRNELKKEEVRREIKEGIKEGWDDFKEDVQEKFDEFDKGCDDFIDLCKEGVGELKKFWNKL